MRALLVTCLLCAALVAAEPPPLKDDPRPVNNICPVTGLAIDPKIPAIVATTKDGREVLIGVADAASADVVRKSPVTYLPAALANKQAK